MLIILVLTLPVVIASFSFVISDDRVMVLRMSWFRVQFIFSVYYYLLEAFNAIFMLLIIVLGKKYKLYKLKRL